MTYIEQKPQRPTRSEIYKGYQKHLQQQRERAALCARKGWSCAGGHTGGSTRTLGTSEYSRRRG